MLTVTITDSAKEKLIDYMKQEDLTTENSGLRLMVSPGGCAGFKYMPNIEIRDDLEEDDLVIQTDSGIDVFIDPFSAQYLEDTTIDYVDTFIGAGFKIENPNATGGCGCGMSFTG